MISAKEIIIGTRKSNLALTQSSQVKDLILSSNQEYQANPSLVKIESFETTGDRILHKNLSEIGGKGLFTKEIEEALLAEKVSLAVHSMKDMPANNPAGLGILAVTQREDARDAFVSKKYKSIQDLPKNAVVGTSSTRRKALILNLRPDLQIVNFRGNVDTRLRKIEDYEVDATILAVCGLKRMQLTNYITSMIEPEEILPAIGQGALAVQCRLDDEFSSNIARKINHPETSFCVEAERAFLSEINGSCKTPIAGYCEIKNGALFLRVLVTSPEGNKIYQTNRTGNFSDAKEMGRDAGLEIKKNAKEILDLF